MDEHLYSYTVTNKVFQKAVMYISSTHWYIVIGITIRVKTFLLRAHPEIIHLTRLRIRLTHFIYVITACVVNHLAQWVCRSQ